MRLFDKLHRVFTIGKKKFVDAEIFEKKVLEHVFIIATRIFRETKALIKNLFLKKS